MPRRDLAGSGPVRSPGQAALDELRASLAEHDDGRDRDARHAVDASGAIERPDRPVPLDEEVRAMSGEVGPNRLRRGPVQRRRNAPGSQSAADPVIPLALSDFHDLRRLGLFGDDGRNPPPSWWAR